MDGMRLWLKVFGYFVLTDAVWIAVLVPVLAWGENGSGWPGVRDGLFVVPGVVLVGAGAALAIASIRALVVTGRGSPLPLSPPAQLVTSGPYAVVRNPQALGLLVMAVGAGLIVDSARVWLVPLLVVAYLIVGLLPSERRHLEEAHGDDYREYRSSVPGWLPWSRGW